MRSIIYKETNAHKIRKEVKYIINQAGCWEVVSHPKCKDGYIKVGRDGKPYLLHRWVYEKEKGTIPDGYVIMHLCDNPSCINPDHLKAGTQLDNIKDRYDKGRSSAAYGAKNGKSKLTDEQYELILNSPKGCTTLARELGVHESAIVTYRRRNGYVRKLS